MTTGTPFRNHLGTDSIPYFVSSCEHLLNLVDLNFQPDVDLLALKSDPFEMVLLLQVLKDELLRLGVSLVPEGQVIAHGQAGFRILRPRNSGL